MSIIKQLIDGEFSKIQYIKPKCEKYESITKKIGDTEKSLLPSLNDEQLKQYYDCVTLLLAREGGAPKKCSSAHLFSALAQLLK